MTLYIYKKKGIQETPSTPYPFLDTPAPASSSPQPAIITRPFPLFPTLTTGFGLLLILFVAWPIISYELLSEKNAVPTTTAGLINPIVERNSQAFAATPKIVGSNDFTKATNWFPQANLPAAPAPVGPSVYNLSIPKLKINEAEVIIGSDDLSKSLIHYAGTATPGQLGSPVIFGHSILPQFYNPTNYMSIFSTLPTLEKGDEIIVEYDSVVYTYLVTEKQEVLPEDLWVLEQFYDSKKLKLITCVPPGLKTKRLVVTAELQQL